jgi:prolyl oligopeptidase
VRAWTAAQNDRTRAVLDSFPEREQWRERLVQLLDVPMVSAPSVAGPTLFRIERGGGREQAVLVAGPLAAPAQATVLYDPHAATGDETGALDWYKPSWDGALVAVGVSTGGDERSTLHVLDGATGAPTGQPIPQARAASVAWLPDGTGFYLTKYPSPEAEERNEGRSIWFHPLGAPPEDDELIFSADDPSFWPDVSISFDGRWLLAHVSAGWSRTDVHLLDRHERAGRTAGRAWRVLIEGVEATTSLRVDGDRLVGVTTLDADRGRVVEASLEQPQSEHWRTIVAEGDAVIEAAVPTSDALLVLSTRSAVSELAVHALDGSNPVAVELPGPVSIEGLAARPDRSDAVVGLGSFTRPPSLFHLDLPAPGRSGQGGSLRALGGAELPFDPDALAVGHERYLSDDGTSVGVFTITAAGHRPSPQTPTILTGYGGFAVTMGPAYSPLAVAVAERGGQMAVAGLRGGSEEGEAWHRAGMLDQKHHVFEDFEAAADHLVATGRTSPDRLAIRGGSNGGLLVAAVLTRRPDLCRAVHCAVPLTDMVRYPQFLIARLWVPEYGDPDDGEAFAVLHGYSPYHRALAAEGTCYPAVLITTGEEDSRVDPNHARKMAAALQASTSCGEDRPILVRVEGQAGHGQGKPVGRQADEAADVLTFLWWQFGA